MQLTNMIVPVRLFAAAKELAESDEVTVEVPPGSTVADVRTALLAAIPALAKIIPHAMWAVDAEFASTSTQITDKNEVALIPPVSGG
jgi:molybdopterin converting factor subunit 1